MTPSPASGSIARSLAGPLWLLLTLAVVISGSWLLYRVEAGRIAEAQRQREALRVGVFVQLLRGELQPVIDTLRLLADGDVLQEYLATGSEAALRAAERRAQIVSSSHPGFDQVRFIEAGGREVLRVAQGGRVVAPHELQDKSDRGYFTRAMQVPPGGLYVSALDLSMENGVVEMPPKPVLRFAMPVVDAGGHVRGIYIINYLGEQLIATLLQAVPTMSNRLRILDAEGFWLKATDPEMEWGFQLPARARFNLARTDPELWAQMRGQVTGQYDHGGAPFTWRHVEPAELVSDGVQPVISDTPYLTLAAQVPAREWQALFTGVRHIFMLVTPGLVLLTLFSAWMMRGRRRALLALRAMNSQLEERVRERTAELAASNRELRAHEELLEEVGQLASVGGWEFDPATGEGAWTAEVARIHDVDPGVKPSRELGMKFYASEARERLETAIGKSLRDGTPYDLELELVSASGVHKWVRTISRPVLQDGRVARMRGAIQDITERKHTELRLHTQLSRMHLLERTTRAIGERQDLQSILQVVIASLETQMPLDFGCIGLYDALDRELTVAALGPASQALAGQLGLVRKAQLPVDQNGLARCVQGRLVYEADLTGTEAPLPKRFAGAGLCSMVAAPLLIESRVFGVLMAARRERNAFSSGDCEFLRQLSEHVALAAHQAQLHGALQIAYEDLTNTQQAVMQQERLRVLGQMASGIAHDINNAISPIMLYTGSLLEKEPGLSERATHALRTIQQAVSDVAETVARMREFYRPREGPGQLHSVQLNSLAMQVPDLTRARWQSMPQQQGIVIDLQLDLTQPLPPVQGIENEIREALVNLVFNAVDAMPGGGRLTLRTRQVREGRICVEVVDTGSGMDEETRRRCLEPFFTTKGERGTGLGLAMVYGVMQRHDGEVEIESAPGAGTTMRLVFNEAESRYDSTMTAPVPVLRGLTLLLVDDDPILLRSLREILEMDGHTILAANHGRQGVEMFRASLLPGARPISLVITDLGMPNVDGRAVASAVKQASPTTPVILLTGWGERLLSEGEEVPHVDRLLGKPPRLQVLRAALAELAGPAAKGG